MVTFGIEWITNSLRRESLLAKRHREESARLLSALKEKSECREVVEALEVDRLNPRRMCVICGHEEEWNRGYKKLHKRRIVHRISGQARQEFYLLRDFLARDEWLRNLKAAAST